MELDKVPTLGTKPVKLTLHMPAPKLKESLAEDLRSLFQQGLCCDVVLLCEDSKFPAHRAVLAARSPVFRETFSKEDASTAKPEVRISCANNPEAVQLMLDHIYELDAQEKKDYNPGTHAVNSDVLRLAQIFQLPGLAHRATHWLSKDVTTGDVVERLATCRDFGLEALRAKLLEQLLANKAALAEVAHGSKIMHYPELMQSLLQQAAGKPADEDEEADGGAAPKKKAKKGGGKGGR